MAHMEKIKLGISACLLGENVRYDGVHKLDSFLKDSLGKYVDYVPVCLEGDPENPRLVTTHSKQDRTDLLVEWARKRVVELEAENLCGFIFKSDSPSCGIKRVKVYNEKCMSVDAGVGIFAKIFIKHFPFLPMEDEESLHDLGLRKNFIDTKSCAGHDKINLDNHLFAVLRNFTIEKIR